MNLQVAARLLVCQIAGTIAGLATAWLFAPALGAPSDTHPLFGNAFNDLVVAFVFALAIGIPFFCIVLIVFQIAGHSIVRRPLIWCILVPTLLLIVGLFAFPPAYWHGIFWVNLIPLSALYAGIVFWLWQIQRPLLARS